jgi:hypothetical protein
MALKSKKHFAKRHYEALATVMQSGAQSRLAQHL